MRSFHRLIITVVVFVVALMCVPPGLAGVTERVSVSSSGTQGNSPSESPHVSADGRYVVFRSIASNLVSGDTNGSCDVFVRDRMTGTTERVSVSSVGAQGNKDSNWPSISADGRYVAFRSYASNLIPDDTNGWEDIFVRDRVAGTTERISVSSGEADYSDGMSISADGRYLAFCSIAFNLVPGDTNNKVDIFVRDKLAGTTERVSVSIDGEEGNSNSHSPSVSADGRFVAFRSSASNLVPGDTNWDYWGGSYSDIFVRDRVTGTTERVSVSFSGEQGDSGSYGPSISSDGRFVVFESSASNLIPDDTNWANDILIKDRVAGTTERVSVSSSGEQGNRSSHKPSISADGRYVAFYSDASNLVPGDTEGAADVFVRDRVSGTTERVSVSSGGEQGNISSFEPSISADGRYVAFASKAPNLVPIDTNGTYDAFVRDRWGLSNTKALDDSAAVVASAQTATASFPGSFYIEDADRSCAIKVAWQGEIIEGNRYRVDGTLATDEDSGERFINASNVRLVDALPVKPMGLRCMSIGGGDRTGQTGVTGGFGLNNIALLVRSWGKVTQTGDGYLYIDDGSGLRDGTLTGTTENVGVRVICDPSEYHIGDYLLVTGISSCFETPSGQIARRIITRRAEDVVKAGP